jgi:hypothetical protein
VTAQWKEGPAVAAARLQRPANVTCDRYVCVSHVPPPHVPARPRRPAGRRLDDWRPAALAARPDAAPCVAAPRLRCGAGQAGAPGLACGPRHRAFTGPRCQVDLYALGAVLAGARPEQQARFLASFLLGKTWAGKDMIPIPMAVTSRTYESPFDSFTALGWTSPLSFGAHQ